MVLKKDDLVTSPDSRRTLEFNPEPETQESTDNLIMTPSSLDEVIDAAQEMGLIEQDLKNSKIQLGMAPSPSRRETALTNISQRFNVKPEQLLILIKRYEVEEAKRIEKGRLFHYHQTGASLREIIEEKGLLSYNLLKQKGKAPASSGSGSRPDIVQMSRDHYDSKGNLIEVGLTKENLGYGNDMVLVLKPIIMDLPEYDGIDQYPGLPKIPIKFIEAVLIEDDSEIEDKQY